MMRILSKMLAPLARRLRLSSGRAILTRIDDAAGVQGVQVSLLEGEMRDKVTRFQQFGFTSHPPAGCAGVFIALGGDRDHGVIVATDDRRYRVKGLEAGETAVYTHDGTIVHLKKDGEIEMTPARRVTITAPDVEMSGNLLVKGNIVTEMNLTAIGGMTVLGQGEGGGTSSIQGNFSITGTIACNGKDIGDTHKHQGVQPGSGSTGTVV